MRGGLSPGRTGWAIRRVGCDGSPWGMRIPGHGRGPGHATPHAVGGCATTGGKMQDGSGVGGGRRMEHAGKRMRGQVARLQAGAADAGRTTALEHRTRTPCACRRTDRPFVFPGTPPCLRGGRTLRPHEHTLTNVIEAKPVRAPSASAFNGPRQGKPCGQWTRSLEFRFFPPAGAVSRHQQYPATPIQRHPITTEESRTCTQFWSPAVSNTA